MCWKDGCRLCKIVTNDKNAREINDTLIDETENFEWVPGLGAFIEGYSLIVCKQHVLNTGSLNEDVIEELETFIMKIKTTLNLIYNSQSIVFEHGTMGGYNNSGCCIEHHHIHVFPLNVPHIPVFLSSNFEILAPIKNMKKLKQFNNEKRPYIYYATSLGIQYVFDAPILPRQYMRQIVATMAECPTDWDWREKPFMNNIITFISKLKKFKDSSVNSKITPSAPHPPLLY